MYSSMKLSDRTISYDTGLNLQKLNEDCDDDELGIVILPSSKKLLHNGTTKSTGVSERRRASRKTGDDAALPDDGIGTSDDETNSNSSTNSGTEQESTSPNMAQSRRVIKLDLAAMSQLLTFDEEEEEDLVESDEDETKANQASHNKQWRKTITKDLAKLSNDKIRRRHSITLCESRHRKSSTESTISNCSSERSQISPDRQPIIDNREFASLNVAAIQDAGYIYEDHSSVPKPLKTLDLRLEEVAHIRSVLTKAELEAMPLDSYVRDSVARGKMCFHCMKTKFGLFYRGQKCEMCKQSFCNKCFTKMRIPVEHFSTIPVFALSPLTPIESQSKRIELDQSLNPVNNPGSRKVSLPSGLPLNTSVGSAPSSPKASPKSSQANLNEELPTISGAVNGPASLPPFMLNTYNKYATLPTKTRRMSWMSARDAQREKLEGSLLTVCVDCKEMVVQVIRVSRSSKRNSRAEFSSISPDTVREMRS